MRPVFNFMMLFASFVVEVEDIDYRRRPEVTTIECALY